MSVKGWSVIFRGHRIQADLLAAVLEANGVRVEVFGDTGYGVGIDFTEARLVVPDQQASTARRLISQAQEAAPAGEAEEEEAPGEADD